MISLDRVRTTESVAAGSFRAWFSTGVHVSVAGGWLSGGCSGKFRPKSDACLVVANYLAARQKPTEPFASSADRRVQLRTASPIAHLFAMFLFYVGLHAGARSIVLERFEPTALVELLARERVTVLGLAPAQLLALLRAPNLTDHDLSALCLVITSGAPCPASAYQEAVARLGCQVVNQWGMTEVQAGALTRPGDPLARTLTTTGRAAPGVELLVTDERGRPLPPGVEGHLWYRGPYAFVGYHDKPEATRAAFAPGGWFRTGDLAALDPDGYVRLVGRSKDLINRGRVKFHPGEIEDLALGHPAVRAAAMVPMPDATLGERACLYVALHLGATLALDELTAYLLQYGVAKYKLPERLELLPELPPTSSGKVQKALLREHIVRRLTEGEPKAD